MSLIITLDGFYSPAQNIEETFVRLNTCLCSSSCREVSLSKAVPLSFAMLFFQTLGCPHISNSLLGAARYLKPKDFTGLGSIRGVRKICFMPQDPILQRPLFQCSDERIEKIASDFNSL